MDKKRWRGKLSVLLYESSQTVLESYVPALEKIFEAAGYPASIMCIVPGSSGHTRDRENIFAQEYFDVVISDVSMGSTTINYDGLNVLNQIKQLYPELFCIAYTGREITYNRYSNVARFDFFIDKQKMLTPAYAELLSKALRERLQTNIFGYVDSACRASVSELSKVEWNYLTRIMRKITYTGASTDKSLHISSVTLKRIRGGYSGAIVLYMQAVTERDLNCLQAVLKLGRRCDEKVAEAIQREAANYKQLVQWHLPYYWRPELLGESHGGPLSALCYAFVGSQDEPYTTLTEMIRRGDPDAVANAIHGIFHPQYQRWYHPNNVTNERFLNRFYNNKCFEGDSGEQLRVFRETMASAYQVEGDNVRIDETTLCPASSWAVITATAGTYQSCLVHGDLNTNNIFVAPGRDRREAKFIDFAETDRGHVFFDFVVFEVSVRLAGQKDITVNIKPLMEAERALNADQLVALPYAESVLSLRGFAKRNFPDEPIENYLYGLAAFSLSIITEASLSIAQRRVLAACACACLLDLETLNFWKRGSKEGR